MYFSHNFPGVIPQTPVLLFVPPPLSLLQILSTPPIKSYAKMFIIKIVILNRNKLFFKGLIIINYSVVYLLAIMRIVVE